MSSTLLCNAENAFFLYESVPELRWFLGDQLTGETGLSSRERQVSLQQGVRQFIRVMTEERPQFLILDDVHWADPASLVLASILTDEETQGLLLVLTYRDHEVDEGHLLRQVHLFAAVHHLNQGSALLGEGDERLNLARHNLEARDRARGAVAFQAAHAAGLHTGPLRRPTTRLRRGSACPSERSRSIRETFLVSQREQEN